MQPFWAQDPMPRSGCLNCSAMTSSRPFCCPSQFRYEALDGRLTNVEKKLDGIAEQMAAGQNSLAKVIIGAAGTIVAGLLSTVVVILMQMS